MNSAYGNCLCGSITFRAQLPSRWVAHCHCTMCQKAGGSAFVTWVGMEESKVAIHDPKKQLNWFSSSSEAKRGFCNTCGTPLFFKSIRWMDEIHITLANFQTPIDKSPQVHAFWDTHVNWVALNDDLPRKTAEQIFNE